MKSINYALVFLALVILVGVSAIIVAVKAREEASISNIYFAPSDQTAPASKLQPAAQDSLERLQRAKSVEVVH